MRTFADRHAHREWRRQFKRDMRQWGRQFKHEMRAGAWRWQQHWAACAPAAGTPPPAPPPFGLLFILPIVAVLRAALAVVCFFSVISLLATHTVFGVAPPANMPLWVALILLLVFFTVISWPLKALRHAWYWHAGHGPYFMPPFFWAVDAVVGLGCAFSCSGSSTATCRRRTKRCAPCPRCSTTPSTP